MKTFKAAGVALTLLVVASAGSFAQDAKPQPAPSSPAKPAVAPALPAAAPNTPAPALATKRVTATPAPPTAAPKPASSAITTAPPAPATNELARNIRFQFDGIPYSDVVERFAQMVNKPLVSDTNAVGTLTFNDPRPYNYAEALETLNLMLSMKGVMLIEDGHYLRLVGLKQLQQMPLRILRGLDQTGDVRGSEVVTVVLDVKNLDSKELGEAILGMLSNAGSLAPLSKGRGLILTDRLANIQRVKSLLAAIDSEAVADRQMKAFTLLHASGAVISDLLNRTFGMATAPKRTQYNPNNKQIEVLPPDPNDYLTAVFDDASRTLVLFGPNERLALAEELISKFEDKEGGGGDVRIYFPQITKAEELATMIRQAIPGIAMPGETAATAATKARVIPDAVLNRLIVAAPVGAQLDQIEQLINRLDKPVHGTGGTMPGLRSQTVQVTKVFRVRTAEATNVAKILTDALSRRMPSGIAVPVANVTVDPNSRSIVVTGSPGDVQTAVDIVTQLETGSNFPLPQQTRYIEIGSSADAKRLVPLIEEIYRSQVADSLGGQTAHAKIMPDMESGRIIVTASEEHLKRVEEIVKQLRLQTTHPLERRLQIIPLKHLQVETALANMQSLITERMSDKQFAEQAKPMIVADAPNNRLLITASDEQFKEIEQVVKMLDVTTERVKREMAVVPVHGKPAVDLIALTTQLMPTVVDEPASAQLAPKLMPDPSGKQIIVLATAKDMERLTNLIQQLDATSSSATARQFKGIELFGRNATELTPLVQQLYTEQMRGFPEPQGGAATLLSETKNNRIMVSGAEREIARVEAIIRQLDPAGRVGAKEETRVIRLRSGLATDLASLVEKSLNAQSQQVKVQVDARSNALVVSGETAGVEAAAKIIEQLDTKSDLQPREMRIFELKQGDAATTAPMVTTLFSEMVRDQFGPTYTVQTKIVSDAAGNRLIVTGPAEELKTVAAVIEKLDQAPEAAGGARVFKLLNADAMQVVGVVSNAMLKFDTRNQPIRRVSVTAERESNSIIVSGPRNDLKDAEGIIQRLDNEGLEPGATAGTATGRNREMKIIEVRTEDPDALAGLTMKVFAAQSGSRNITNLLSITPEPSGKRLIVLAPASMLPQVESAIATLDAKPEQSARELQTVELKSANAAELLPVVNRIYSEQNIGRTTRPATIYADAAGTRLMVYGTKDQVTTVKQIVETAQGEARAPRESKVFEVGKLADAQRLMPLMQQLYKDQVASDSTLGLPDAQFVSDGRTGRLIVSARQAQMKPIEEIFARLQVGTVTNPPARETRSFEVGNAADVQRLLPLVQQLYTDQWKDRNETDPADAQVMGDAKTGRLIVTGKPEHVKAIEAILKQLGAETNPETFKVKSAARDTRIFDLTTANAVELSTTVRTLYLDEAKSRWGAMTPDTLIVSDVGGNRLIVTGETNELDAIEEIVKKLDKVSAQSASARVFKLKSADPAKVAEILTTAMVRYDAYGRSQKRAAVTVDPKSRTLIVTGDPKELQGVSVIIEQLDASLGTQPERKMKVVTLQKGKVSELLPKVRQLYTDQITAQPELGTTEFLILDDATSNQLILAGSDAQLTLLEKIISDLQAAQTAHGPRETKMIEIGQADELTRLLPLVQQLYTERWRDKAIGDPADAQITPDPRNARFIVTGRTNHIAEIEKIVGDLRTAELNQPRDTRIFDLTTANAVEFSSTVRSLYQDQSKNRPGAQTQETSILPDVSANRLIVTGTSNELAVVEEIIKKLDKVTAQSGTVRVFKLKSADPTKVVEILGNALTSYDSYNRPRRRVGLTLDAKTRTIIVAGDPKELQSLQNAAMIIEQLDSALGTQAERKIKVVTLKQAKVAEMSAKVRQLYNDQLSSQPDLGTTDVLILDDAPSNQLILAGSDTQLLLLDKIITDLQAAVVAQGSRETKVIEIGPADEVERLQPLVTQLYQDRWKNKEANDPADAQVLADAKNGKLILTGRTNHLVEIEAFVQQLRSAQSAEARETRVYELNSSSAPELAQTVNQLYQEQLKTRPTAGVVAALIVPDVAANRLVVSGLSNELAAVEAIVQKLDSADALGGRTRVFKLKNVDPAQASLVLSTALKEIDRVGRSIPRITVGTDTQNNLLIVSGKPQDLQSASLILEQMEQTASKESRQMRIVTLKTGVATEVASRVKELYQDQLKGRTEGGPADAQVLGDDVTSRLIITASETHLKLIEEIISQLQQVGESPSRQMRILPLQRNSAASISTMVSQLFSRQTSSQDPTERLVVTPSADDRTIVLEAAGPTLEKVEELVKNLDGTNAPGVLEVRTYQIPEGNAAELAPTLTRLFAERAGPKAVGLAPRFEADANVNVLMVAATKEQFEQIDKLVIELKKTAEVANEIRTFKLQNGDAVQVAQVLEAMLAEGDATPGFGQGQGNLFRQRQQRQRFRPGVGLMPVTDNKSVRVAPAPAMNAVVVQGPPEKLSLAEKLIETLDKSDLESRTVIQTVHLKKGRAETVAEAVTQSIAARQGQAQGRLQRVSVTAVESANSLLINGPEDAVTEVMKIIKDLDTEGESDEIEVHIYKLENGSAKEVSSVLQQLLQNVSRAQMRGRNARFIPASVTVDDRNNALVISATRSHFKLVEQILPTLDKSPDRSDRDVHFVWLKNAKAEEVVPRLQTVFEGRAAGEKPVIEADLFANSITVIGRKSDVVQIQDLITKLDDAVKDSSVVVRFRPIENIPVEQMARMLQNIYPQMANGRIRVAEKVAPPKQEKPAPVTVPVNGNKDEKPDPATPPKEENKDAETASPEVVIAIDKDANALILSGPAHELDQIDRIVSDLAYSAISGEAELRVFMLKEADPVIVARTITDLFRAEQVRIEQPLGAPVRPGEVRTLVPPPKMSAVAEPRTRSVIIRAKPTDFTLLENLIKQLDTAGVTSQLEFRLVTLSNAPPEKIAPLVQHMVTQLNLLRPGEPLTVSPDPRTRGLLVVARTNVFEQLEKLIRSLDTPSAYVEAEVLVLTLKKASAPQLALVLQGMLAPAATGQGLAQITPEARELQEQVRRLKIQNDQGQAVTLDLSKPIKVQADPMWNGAPGANRLILTSTPDNLKALSAVVEMMDTVAITDGVQVKMVQLEYADAATVSQTLNTIFQQAQRFITGPAGRGEPTNEIGRALVNPLNVATDPRSNTLIMSGEPATVELAMKVVTDLDKKEERFVTEVKLFRLKHASATRLVPLLQAVFAEGPPIPGLEGVSTYVTRLKTALENGKAQTTEQSKRRAAMVMQADDLSNILIVAARTDALPLIEQVINQLDIPEASGLATLRVYPLQHADAAVIQKIVTDLFAGPKAATIRNEDKPNITLDERSNTMIVSGNEKSFAIIDSLLAKLDVALPLEFRDIHIVPLEHADASELAGSLQKLMDARVTQRSTLGKGQADSLRVLIVADQRSNALLVGGGKDSFELVQSLARELDQAETALSGKIRLVPLQYADARAMVVSLNQLFAQRYTAARTPETQRKRPVIVADPRANALLISAGMDDNAVIDDLLSKLDRKLDDPAMAVTVIALKHNDATRISTMLEGVFTARQRNRTVQGVGPQPTDMVEIQPESLNNSLVVYASKENLEIIQSLLEKIDVEPVAADGVIEMFTLEYADAQRVSAMLRTLVQQGLYRPGAPAGVGRGAGAAATRREALAVSVDPRSNTLIVSASPENLAVVKEIVKKVDTKDFAADGNVKLYALKHARASSLATVLGQFFQAKRQGEAQGVNAAERSIPVTITPDDRSNALLVTGTKEGFDVIERLITQLDAEDTMSRMNFRVFTLKRATATSLQPTLQRLFANRPPRVKGEPLDPITLVADAWVNALLVGASIEDMNMVAELIERLDSEMTDPGLAVQVLPLAKADARRVAQTIQALYREGTPGVALPVVVNADERINAIIVSAGEADLTRIRELVAKLDTDQVARVSEIRVVALKYARAETLSTILNTALNTRAAALSEQSPNTQSLLQFITRSEDGRQLVTSALKEGVMITPDARMNSLIVSAPVDYIDLLEQIIAKLDTSSPRQAKIKVFALQNADARQTMELLLNLFRLQQIGGGTTANQRSIQYTLIKPASDTRPGTEESLASAVIGSDEQSALTVTVDPRTNSLLVGGTDHYVALVEEIINALDSSTAQERRTEIIRLRNAQAPDVATAISTFLTQERQRVVQVLGQEAVGTAQRMLEREVAIVADQVSNTLLLSASPRFFEEISKLIEKLDEQQPQVLIQVLLAEVTLDSLGELGLEWAYKKDIGGGRTLGTGTMFNMREPANADFGSQLNNFANGYSAVMAGGDLQFLLRALQNDGRLEVLTRPQILTADNKPASINIGQRIPLITDSRVTAQNDTVNSFRYEDVGVSLTVTPRISSEGFVSIEVGTTNSALSSSTVEINKNATVPIINSRRANTTVNVQSGQTVVIGGLIATVDDTRTKKVPILGDVPGLGFLFRSRKTQKDRKELLIMLTPQVLVHGKRVPEEMTLEGFSQQEMRQSGIKDQIRRDDVQKKLLEPFFPERRLTPEEMNPDPVTPPDEPPKKDKSS